MGSNIDALIAAGIRPPQVADPTEVAMRAMQMRDMQQAAQLRSQLAPLQIAAMQQEGQQRQMDIDQRLAVNKAYQDAFTADPSTGAMSLDTDKLTKALATGGHGSAIQPILEGVTKYKQAQENFLKTTADVDLAHKNFAGAAAYAIRQANYDPNLMSTFVRDMVNNKLIPPDQANQILAHIDSALQQDLTGDSARAFIKPYVDRAYAESPQQQELELKRQTEARAQKGEERAEALAPSQLIESQSKARLEQFKAMSMERMAKMTPDDWNATVDRIIPPSGDTANLNTRTKGLVQDYAKRGEWDKAEAAIKDASDQIGRTETGVRTAKATAPIKVEVTGREAAARAPKLSDAGEEFMAEQALAGRPIPSRNPVVYARVMDRAAQLAKERGLTTQQAVMEGFAAKANQTALTALTKQYGTLKPFGEMAEKNADILEQKLKDVVDLGAPILNTPIRSLADKFGNTRTAALTAAIQPVQNEFARVLNSATGSGVLSDSARHEMQQVINPGATLGQIRASLGVLRNEWQNRKAYMEAQIEDLKRKSVVGGATTQADGARQYVREAAGPNGHRIGQTADGKWYDKQTGQPIQ